MMAYNLKQSVYVPFIKGKDESLIVSELYEVNDCIGVSFTSLFYLPAGVLAPKVIQINQFGTD